MNPAARIASLLPEAESGPERGGRRVSADVPQVSPTLVNAFTRYCRWYLRRHFHSVRCLVGGMPGEFAGLPLVVYVNHASWWDPLVGLLLRDALFPRRTLYAPMAEQSLQRYGMFRRFGFFGVANGTGRGAVQFLRTSQAILSRPASVLTITPQARFADCRLRPPEFAPGLGLLASRCSRAVFLAVALEYVFWEERLPEVLVHFGPPVRVDRGRDPQGVSLDPQEWSRFFEGQLAEAQDALAAAAQRRTPAEFQVLLRGGSGQGGVYDCLGALGSWFRGRRFNPEHGTK